MRGAGAGSEPVTRVAETAQRFRQSRDKIAAFVLCAEHVRQLGGGSPLLNLVEVKS